MVDDSGLPNTSRIRKIVMANSEINKTITNLRVVLAYQYVSLFSINLPISLLEVWLICGLRQYSILDF
jgi:hypothetical protein